VHIGNSSDVLVSYDNDQKNDIAGLPNTKGPKYTGTWYHFKKIDTYPCCFLSVCVSVSVSVSVCSFVSNSV
jgi:hypothetical protein